GRALIAVGRAGRAVARLVHAALTRDARVRGARVAVVRARDERARRADVAEAPRGLVALGRSADSAVRDRTVRARARRGVARVGRARIAVVASMAGFEARAGARAGGDGARIAVAILLRHLEHGVAAAALRVARVVRARVAVRRAWRSRRRRIVV